MCAIVSMAGDEQNVSRSAALVRGRATRVEDSDGTTQERRQRQGNERHKEGPMRFLESTQQKCSRRQHASLTAPISRVYASLAWSSTRRRACTADNRHRTDHSLKSEATGIAQTSTQERQGASQTAMKSRRKVKSSPKQPKSSVHVGHTSASASSARSSVTTRITESLSADGSRSNSN